MAKDPRYDAVKALIDGGRVKELRDIFNYIPKTVVYLDIGGNYTRFDKCINDPLQFTLQELVKLSELCEVESKKMVDLAYDQGIDRYKRKRRGARP